MVMTMKLHILITKALCKVKTSVLIWSILVLAIGQISTLEAQQNASPANWLYPQGNSEGVRRVEIRSSRQYFDSMSVKWATPLISGHVQPLVGNIVNNDKIFPYFPYAPNEMAAVVGDRLVIIDGRGKVVAYEKLPDALNGVIGISALLDTSFTNESSPFRSPTVVLGLETIEAPRSDSLAVAFIVGYDHTNNRTQIIRRFSLNLKEASLNPNVSASMKPVYARKDGDEFIMYATFNMAQPTIGNSFFVEPPFLRGLTQFNTYNAIANFPLPDIGDDRTSRVTVGPEVSFTQPSQTNKIEGKSLMLLPSYPTPGLLDIIPNDITSGGTAPDKPYVMSFDLSLPYILEDFPLMDMSFIAKGTRPRMRPLYVNILDNATGDSMFVLVLEEYNGRNGSNGKSAIHLFDMMGNQLTSPENINEPPYLPPSFAGGQNHYWSVAVGDVDGNSSNQWLPHYPNNRGNEIVVTQSSKEFAFAGSRLSVLRYYSGPETDKPSPPGEYLFALDTIASQKINGWVAAVNDFDGDLSDGKDEIFLVNGSEVIVLRMRNYNSFEFRMGNPFDTVFTMNFPNQTISNLAIADLDGDGLNEMIVTTFDTTYVVGTPLRQTIALVEPRYFNAPQTDFCPLDTVVIRWSNITGTDKAHILFIETINGIPIPSTLDTIRFDFPNSKEEEIFRYVVDERVLGKEGFFIITSASNPAQNFDTTTIMRFHNPNIILDTWNPTVYYSGSEFTLTGTAQCADSVSFEFSYDGINWTTLSKAVVFPNNSFSLLTKLPCLDLFKCSEPDRDSLIYAKVLATRGRFTDSSSVWKIRVLPSPFPVKWDTCTTGCPTLHFKWNELDFNYPCDNVIVSVSADMGITFTEIAMIDLKEGEFIWNIPTVLPDTVVMRFCCENSCIRTDTVVAAIQPKYIQIIAPNPVSINDVMEVIYTVPRETNVTIRLFDQSNRIVRELVKSAPRSPNTAYCEFWDGRLSDGTPVANGLYYLILEMSDGSREAHPVYIRK